MTTLPVTSAAIAAKQYAAASWTAFTSQRNLRAPLTSWHTGTAPDGSPTVTAQVTGRGAGHALRRFAADYYMVLGQAGDVRPQFDVAVPGRTALVWRTGGVWVELWHPDTADTQDVQDGGLGGPVRAVEDVVVPAVAVPAVAASAAARRLFLRRPSGRLPFTRKQRTTNSKESATS